MKKETPKAAPKAAVKPMGTEAMPANMAHNPVTGVQSPSYRLDAGEALPDATLNLNPDRAK